LLFQQPLHVLNLFVNNVFRNKLSNLQQNKIFQEFNFTHCNLFGLWVQITFLNASGRLIILYSKHTAQLYRILIAIIFVFQFFSKPVIANPVEITLGETISLALRSNRSVKGAYLDRVVQKLSLEVSQDKFNPDVTLTANQMLSQTTTTSDTTEKSKLHTRTNTLTSELSMIKTIQTGGNIVFSWARTDQFSKITGSDANTWMAQFTQPLLKGAGIDVNTASVTLAEMDEQSNLLSLKDSVTSTVSSVIRSFRSYAQAKRQVEIARASVKRAKDLLGMNRVLISLGRMAANEIIQTESDVANREFSYETALNSRDNSRLSLLKVLDIDRHTMIIPMEEEASVPVHPDFQICLDMALKNRSDHLNTLILLERAKINLMLAKDNRLWTLDATGSYSITDEKQHTGADSDTDVWSVGLSLSAPIYGDLTRKLSLISAQTSLKKAQLSLEESLQNIEIEVQDAVREVETKLKQVGMAKRARILSEKKLDVEEEKLKVGRSSNFQLVSFQNELVTALNEELNANIAYRNALTSLDLVIGNTLFTWQIEYNKEYDKWPGK